MALSLVAILTAQPTAAAPRQATGDSLVAAGPAAVRKSRGPRRPLPPMAALGVGLVATAVPTMLAYGTTTRDTKEENLGLFVGLTAGIVAGPAVGLWSGDRGDLAGPGMIVRGVAAAVCLGASTAASSSWESGSGDTAVFLGIVSVAAGLYAAGSVIHDLAITPSATGEARRLRAGLVIRPDGRLAMSVRF